MAPPPEIETQNVEISAPRMRKKSATWKRIAPESVSLEDSIGILHNPHFNKGTAFTEAERRKFHLEGLLPPIVESLEEQAERALSQLRHFTVALSKHIYLCSLRERNETLFYKIVCENLIELMPLIYTPTVGEACVQFGSQYRQAEGMYICRKHRNRIRHILDNWHTNKSDEVSFIVVTDGSRILGLGDLGANGMGIPIGKSSLYVAAGGFHPATALPVVLDCGVDTESVRNDPCYLGLPEPRLPDEEYFPLVEEFMLSVKEKWPGCLVQFEDFSNNHAFSLLEIWRKKMLCFNDDIQGTGCVVAAGFLSALRLIPNIDFKEAKVVVFGSGSAAVGVAKQICNSLVFKYKIDPSVAKKMFHLVDRKGLVTHDRGDKLPDFKEVFAREAGGSQFQTLKETIFALKPFAIIGLSTQPKTFDAEVIEFMAQSNERPIIMPLSNPTSKSECSAEEAFKWTKGTALFASGSPFPAVSVGGKSYIPSQGNNLYTFPGIGFGSWYSGASSITDNMLTAAVVELSNCVSEEELNRSELYPSIASIRDHSARIATAVIQQGQRDGTVISPPKDFDILLKEIKSAMYYPKYTNFS